jgi:hypothetical protein
MLRTCPSHGMEEWTVLHYFYNGLNYMSRSSATRGAFMTKTVKIRVSWKTCYKITANGTLIGHPTPLLS